jgi:hypothetical protein
MDAAQTQRERNKSSVRVEQLEKQCLCHCPAQRARHGAARSGEPTISIAAQPVRAHAVEQCPQLATSRRSRAIAESW